MAETIEERRERNRHDDERRQSAARVEARREAMHDAKDRMLFRARATNRCHEARDRVVARHPDVADADLRTATMALAVVIPFAAVFIDGLLNGGTIDWLLGQAPDLGAKSHPTSLRLFTLSLIVLIELEIGLAIAHACDEGRKGLRRAIAFSVAGVALAASMAWMTLIITSAHTRTSHLRGYAGHMPWIAVGLTLVVHGLTICAGHRVRTGASWLSLRLQLAVLDGVAGVVGLGAGRAQQAVVRNFAAYTTGIDRHNLEYPAYPLRFGPIDIEMARVLRTLIPASELARWLGAEPNPPDRPTGADPPPSNQPPATTDIPTADPPLNHETDDSVAAAEAVAAQAETEVTV